MTVKALPGRPDIVFGRERVVVFCDGDFWHGRDLEARIKKLRAGHNAPYWVQKIRRNVERDVEHNHALEAAGWRVLRFWETEILANVEAAARHVQMELEARRTRVGPSETMIA